ncbi:MAG: hypothetical protein KTR31_40620 [Myxococcales bacterium]|nr:hypothetical protein [Myxococcales bacterium]
MRRLTMWVAVTSAACRPALGVLDDDRRPGLDPLSSEGTGDGSDQYAIVVDVVASAPQGAEPETSQVSVQIRDVAGDPVSELTVEVGGERLEPGPLLGSYEGELAGYFPGHALLVDGALGRFEAAAVGPSLHELQHEETWIAAQANTLTWSPTGADAAAVTSTGVRVDLADDPGSYVFEADTLPAGLAPLGVIRATTLDLSALPGSRFTITLTVTSDVTVLGEESGEYGVEGELRVDSDWQDEVATAYVLATPADSDEPTVWTQISDFEDREDYELTGLGPGEWELLAYLDLDDSDGSSSPAGPTDGDPYDTSTVTLDEPGLLSRELRMERAW